MRSHQALILLFLFFSLANPLAGKAQTNSDILRFTSKKGLSIVVEKGAILVNGKELHRMKEDIVIYDGNRNKLIEDGGSVFLFLEMGGSPNLDRLYAFEVSDTKVQLLANAISSDLKDLDGDGYLEFGGCDLTEHHPSEDSMYYIPFDYYEIRKGRILYDSAYSKKKDIEVNGVFLLYPMEAGASGCCTVIIKPGLKKVSLVDSLPENTLAKLVDQDSYENIGISRLKDFIKGFGFSKGRIGTYIMYQLDEKAVYGHSSSLRLALVFNGDELFAVVHRRKMPLRDSSIERLNRGYYLSVIASPNLEYTGEFVKEFNVWIK